MAISLIFPLKPGFNGFESFSDSQTKEAIKQNLKMLLLTSPGEYVMDLQFGVGLYNYLFELETRPSVGQIKPSIYRQVATYMPYLHIIDIETQFGSIDNNALSVKINYKTSESEIAEVFNLVVSL